MNSNFFSQAIQSLAPGAQWYCHGDDYNELHWLSEDIPKPTLEEIEAEAQKLQQEWEAKEYQRLRAPKYPNLTVLADALYWSSKGDNSHLEAYYASCEEVKNEYPKS